jgi:hypothetical protein
MDGGSIHPHGKLDKVNIERRRDHRSRVVAAEYLWAASFSLQHSHRQAVGSRIRSETLSLFDELTPSAFRCALTSSGTSVSRVPRSRPSFGLGRGFSLI